MIHLSSILVELVPGNVDGRADGDQDLGIGCQVGLEVGETITEQALLSNCWPCSVEPFVILISHCVDRIFHIIIQTIVSSYSAFLVS